MINQAERVAILVEEFSRCDFTQFCMAPGSRSTPVVLAGLESESIRFRVFHDERSMAFFALGIARRGKTIPVILTTSGTAVANLLPAVIEARADGVSLIVISADRPSSQHGRGANQTIDQLNIFGTSTPTITIDEDLTGSGLLDLVSNVRQQMRDKAGPVHINLPLRKPLLEVADLSKLKEPKLVEWFKSKKTWKAPNANKRSLESRSDMDTFDTLIVGANPHNLTPNIERLVSAFEGETFFDIQSGSWTCGTRPLSAEVFGEAKGGGRLLIIGHRFTEHRIWEWISHFDYVEQWKGLAGIFDPNGHVDKSVDLALHYGGAKETFPLSLGESRGGGDQIKQVAEEKILPLPLGEGRGGGDQIKQVDEKEILPLPLGEGRGGGDHIKQVDRKNTRAEKAKTTDLPEQLESPTLTLPQRERGQKVSRIPKHLLDYARELRVGQTDAEKHLWYFLRKKNIAGAKFRRQHPLGPYIVDFYCHERKLVVELDGSQHLQEKDKRYDAKRTKYLNEEGIRVLRFDNIQMLTQTIPVLESIFSAIHADDIKQVAEEKILPLPLGEGRGGGDHIKQVAEEKILPLPLGEGRGGGDHIKQVDRKNTKAEKAKTTDLPEQLGSPTLTLPQRERGQGKVDEEEILRKNTKAEKAKTTDLPEQLESPTLTLPQRERGQGKVDEEEVLRKNTRAEKANTTDLPEQLESPTLTLPQRERGQGKMVEEGESRELTFSKLVSLISVSRDDFQNVHLANSLTVRAFDRFRPTGIFRTAGRLTFNRGASGIDGTLATGLGTAYDGAPTLIVCGDHSFLYDLSLLPDLHDLNLKVTVVIVDNDGGRIFEHLPIRENDALNDYFVACPKVELSKIISAFGFACVEANTTTEFSESLALEYEGVRFIIANVDPDFDLKDFSERTKERFT